MRKFATFLALLALSVTSSAFAATEWVEGKHYFLVEAARPTAPHPGKVIVTEVFSYACPACNLFYPVVNRLKAALPPNVEFEFVAASFRPDEDWPMFQRAYYAAKALGVDRKTHEAMFDAVWKTGELGIVESDGRRLKQPPPSIEDAAKWYAAKTGIKADQFVAAANSFSVAIKMREADDFLKTYRVSSTPTIVVNGKYRTDPGSAGKTYDDLIELVKYLVAKESH